MKTRVKYSRGRISIIKRTGPRATFKLANDDLDDGFDLRAPLCHHVRAPTPLTAAFAAARVKLSLGAREHEIERTRASSSRSDPGGSNGPRRGGGRERESVCARARAIHNDSQHSSSNDALEVTAANKNQAPSLARVICGR